MGRRPLPPEQKRSHEVRLRLTADEHRRLQAGADAAGRPLARWLREEALYAAHEAITDLARLALEQAERIAWLERDGKCQSMHKQDARIARLEAVVEAARERHDGCEVAGTSRCGVCWVCAAVNALDEEGT